jgi:hypothetical protein
MRTAGLPTALVTALVACSHAQPGVARAVVTYERGLPPSATPSRSFHTEPVASWADPRRIYVVTYGSSSCPSLPTVVRADGPHRVTIMTKEHLANGDDGCTSDLGPTTSTVTLPKDTDVTTPLTVDIDSVITKLPPQ